MAIAQRMSEAEYEKFVLSGAAGLWELHDGVLVEKPGMSWEHLDAIAELVALLRQQLDRTRFRAFAESRVRRPTDTIFMPDVMVVPTAYGDRFRGKPGKLAIFLGPLPLVVEVWSASTGDYDVDTKIPAYMQRGDLEIWRIHPYDRTLTSWVRQADGSYRETVYRGGVVHLAALPDVSGDLDQLFGA
jgi:Uma2 family endonuclease